MSDFLVPEASKGLPTAREEDLLKEAQKTLFEKRQEARQEAETRRPLAAILSRAAPGAAAAASEAVYDSANAEADPDAGSSPAPGAGDDAGSLAAVPDHLEDIRESLLKILDRMYQRAPQDEHRPRAPAGEPPRAKGLCSMRFGYCRPLATVLGDISAALMQISSTPSRKQILEAAGIPAGAPTVSAFHQAPAPAPPPPPPAPNPYSGQPYVPRPYVPRPYIPRPYVPRPYGPPGGAPDVATAPPNPRPPDFLRAAPADRDDFSDGGSPRRGGAEVPEAFPEAVPEAFPEAVPEAFPEAVPEAVPEAFPRRSARSADALNPNAGLKVITLRETAWPAE